MSNNFQTPKYLCKKERLKFYRHLKVETHVTARLLKYLQYFLIPLLSEKSNFYTLAYSAVLAYHFQNNKSKHKINMYSYTSIYNPVCWPSVLDFVNTL